MSLYTTGQTKLYRQVVADLIRHEGFKKYAYADPLTPLYRKVKASLWGTKPARELLPPGTKWSTGEPWTVGIGYTKGVTVDSVMELDRAKKITEGEVAELDAQLLAALPWYKDASFATKTIMINMAYNLGLAGFLKFKNTLAYIKAGDYAQSAKNMALSLWYAQVGARGKELAERMRSQTIPQEFIA